MSKTFASTMPMDGDEEYVGLHHNGGDRRGPKHKNKNARGKRKTSGSKSKEHSPGVTAEGNEVRKLYEKSPPAELQQSFVNSPQYLEQAKTEEDKFDVTSDEHYFTANNSAEELQNGNSVFTGVHLNELEDEINSNNTSTSVETLSPNVSVIKGSKSVDDKSEGDSSVETSEEEDSVINASLAVNLSDTIGNTMALNSFVGPSLDSSMSASPLTSSRSAPPDLSTIMALDQDSIRNAADSIVYDHKSKSQFQTSTPISSSPTSSSKRSDEQDGTLGAFTTGGPAGWESTIYADDPTTEQRANLGFRVDDSTQQNSTDFGFTSTKESGIGDMSSPIVNYSEAEADTGQTALINKSLPQSNKSSDEVPISVNAKPNDNEAPVQVPKPSKSVAFQDAAVHIDSGSDADEEVEEINKPFMLPITVTELTADNGVKVYLVGTAHFSRESQLDVVHTIQKVQPTVVLLELCPSRSGMLQMNEEQIMKEAADMSLAKVKATIKQSGPIQGFLHLLLLQMTASLTKKLGMAPGGEFRVALQEAQKIPGCAVHLGDRDLAITLNRALSGLSAFQKLKLAWHFIRANDTDITKEEVEACKEKDLLEKLLVEMAGEFPSITKVLLDERDLYLAHSLWMASTSHRVDRFGYTEPNIGPVVGVVGMGHVAGIVKNWGKVGEDTISEIVEVPEPPLSHVIIGKAIKVSSFVVLGYIVYKSSRKLFSFPSDSLIKSMRGIASSAFKKLDPKFTQR